MRPDERRVIGAKLMACYGFIYNTLVDFGVRHEDAPDAVQDVMLAAVRRWDAYRPEYDIEGWLHGICRKVASNLRRKKRRRPAELWDVPPPVTVASHEARIEARSVLATLPEHLEPLCRALSDNGYMVAPAARELGVDDESIRVRLVQLRQGADVAPLISRKKGALGHATGCACWRCKEARGVDDGLAPFRAREADPTTCTHPDDDKHPHSGGAWSCGHCGADVEGPPGVTALERIFNQEDFDDE